MDPSAVNTEKGVSEITEEQDGPSLESSSYLNVTLKYLGPWDPGILGLLDLSLPSSNTSYFLLPPLTSSDLLLSLPPTLLLLYGLVWEGWGGWVVEL